MAKCINSASKTDLSTIHWAQHAGDKNLFTSGWGEKLTRLMSFLTPHLPEVLAFTVEPQQQAELCRANKTGHY